MKKEKNRDKKWADYYERVDILEELLEEPVEFSMNDQLWDRIGGKLRAKGVRQRDIDRAIKEVRKSRR